MKRPVYLVARPLTTVSETTLEYLDTTDPDTWTLYKNRALSSEDQAWIRRHSERRPGTMVVER